jgi:CP family cyanate transporter-like MFS transporter
VSAAMLTVSYSLAVIVAVVSGITWDVTGIPMTAFVPMGLCALILFVVPPALPFKDGAAGRG